MNDPTIPPNAKPFQRTDLPKVVSSLTRMFLSFRERTDDAKALAEVYADGVSDLPEWAISAACDRFIRGKVADRATKAFAPSVAELHEVADQLVAEEERHQRLTLPAPGAERRELHPPRPLPAARPHPSWDILAMRSGVGGNWGEVGSHLAKYTGRFPEEPADPMPPEAEQKVA